MGAQELLNHLYINTWPTPPNLSLTLFLHAVAQLTSKLFLSYLHHYYTKYTYPIIITDNANFNIQNVLILRWGN